MNKNRKTRNIRKIILEVLFWLIIQAGILNNALSFAIMLDPFRFRYYGIWGSMTMYVFYLCFTFTVIVNTIIGVVINDRIPINSRKWWKAASICYVIYLLLSTLGAALIGKQWFWDGFGNYLMAVVWLAPVLWFAELEIVHNYLTNQHKSFLDTLNDTIIK